MEFNYKQFQYKAFQFLSIVVVRPTFIECLNVKGYHTVGTKGLAHRVPRPLKQPRSLNCKSFWKISALTHPFSLHRTSARLWRSTQVQVSSTSVSRSRKLVLEPSLSKLSSWFTSGITVWIQSPLSCHCFSYRSVLGATGFAGLRVEVQY